jgi:HEPN domain-containing protein
MRKSKEEAERWLRQAEYNLKVAESNFAAGLYAAACFMSEQTVQMALKSYLILKTGRSPLGIHSIQKLADKCSQFDSKFKEFSDFGKVLDRYYIPTRYPDALTPPAVPFETYTLKDAQIGVEWSKEIVSYIRYNFDKL